MSRKAQPMLVRCLLAASLMVIAGVADAQHLGRLFSTEQERLYLDEIRREFRQDRPPEPEQAPREREFETTPALSRFTVNGVVLSGHGVGAAWINGAKVGRDDLKRAGIKVTLSGPGQHVRILLPRGSGSDELKVGQTLDGMSGLVVEAHEFEGSRDSPLPAVDRRGPGETVRSPSIRSREARSQKDVSRQLEVTRDAGARLETLVEGHQ